MNNRYQLNLPWIVGIVAIWIGIASAMYTLHWIDPSFKILRREPYISIVCLLILLGNLITCRPPSRRWTTLRNFLLYSLGVIYPFCIAFFMLKNEKSDIATLGHWKMEILIACGIVIFLTWSFLRSKGVIKDTKRRIRPKPGHDPAKAVGRLVPAGKVLEYKANFNDILAIVILCTLLGIAFIAMGILAQPPSQIAVIIGSIILLIPIVVRLRCKVTVSSQQISSTGFFKTRTVNLADITAAYWIQYPVIEIQTRDDRAQINFKLFSLECMRTVMDIVEGPDESKSSQVTEEDEIEKPRRG
jgi:cytochrome c biogenesis protein CcdA